MATELMTDEALLAAIKSYLDTHRYVTRSELRRKLRTSFVRIERIAAAAGVTLPLKLSRSEGATLGRKKSGTCKHWYINRPAPWQTKPHKGLQHETHHAH